VIHYGVFFFFQAEDGIRDRTVTGVQTCALPISRAWWRRPGLEDCDWSPPPRACRPGSSPILRCVRSTAPRSRAGPSPEPRCGARSEERRVGKECRPGGGRGRLIEMGELVKAG